MIIHTEFNKDKFKFVHYQDMDGIIQGNKELAKGDGWDKDRNHRHLARIPNLAYFKMIKKYPEVLDGDALSKQKALYKALADPEFAIFKLRHE